MRRRYSTKFIVWLVSLILAIFIPPIFGGYLKTILTLVCIWIIMGISLNLIYGYIGLLSLAHSAFFGIGAYSFALLTGRLEITYWLAFFFSIVIVGVFAFLIGIPSLRLRGPYFILVSLSFAMIVHMIILSWDRLTGGANGIPNIPRPPKIPLPFGIGLEFSSLLSMYYLILIFLVLIALINYRLVNSLIGKRFIAISLNEDLSESLGINTMRSKLLCFIISSTFAAVAGILFASYNSVISPHVAHFTQGFNALVYVVIGGLATIAGPFIGSLVLIAVPELLQVVPELKTLIYGVVLVVFVIFMPSGIAGGFKLQWPTLAALTKRLKRI